MSSSIQTLRRSWRLLARYLKPHTRLVVLLGITLAATIAVQVTTPLVAGRFIDEATSGGAMRDLVNLALLTIALALAGQALAVAETWVAES